MMTWSAAPTGAGIRPVNRHAQPEEGRWRAGGSTNDRTAFRGRLLGRGASGPHGPRLAAAPIRNHVPRAAAGSLAGTGCARAAVDPRGRARAPHRGRRRRGRRSEASALAAPALAKFTLEPLPTGVHRRQDPRREADGPPCRAGPRPAGNPLPTGIPRSVLPVLSARGRPRVP